MPGMYYFDIDSDIMHYTAAVLPIVMSRPGMDTYL